MQPSIGRIVHYQWDREQPYAGIITALPYGPESTVVDIEVFGFSGPKPPTVAVPFSEEPRLVHWSWPPRT